MKLVIIEEDRNVAAAISLCLELGWPEVKVICTQRGRDGLELIKRENASGVVLDADVTDMDGFEVCRRVRRFSDVGIVMLSGRGQEMDKVRGLGMGADDYVVMPFSYTELLARIRAVMRRYQETGFPPSEQTFSLGNLQIDFDACEVRLQGKKVKLTSIEYNLLAVLARNEGRVIPHKALMKDIWGEDYSDESGYLKVYIQRLRMKLGDPPSAPALLFSERGVGYMLGGSRKDNYRKERLAPVSELSFSTPAS